MVHIVIRTIYTFAGSTSLVYQGYLDDERERPGLNGLVPKQDGSKLSKRLFLWRWKFKNDFSVVW